MDNVVTSILVLDGKGNIEEHVGGYSDWAGRGGRLYSIDDKDAADEASALESTVALESKPAEAPARKKLSYKDQRELDALPDLIEELEQQQSELEAAISAPDFYQQDHAATSGTLEQLAAVKEKLEAAYARWEELSD
jgi:ATP-binding cassette subfamily F protein uup